MQTHRQTLQEKIDRLNTLIQTIDTTITPISMRPLRPLTPQNLGPLRRFPKNLNYYVDELETRWPERELGILEE